jgi:hypothetical protein
MKDMSEPYMKCPERFCTKKVSLQFLESQLADANPGEAGTFAVMEPRGRSKTKSKFESVTEISHQIENKFINLFQTYVPLELQNPIQKVLDVVLLFSWFLTIGRRKNFLNIFLTILASLRLFFFIRKFSTKLKN